MGTRIARRDNLGTLGCHGGSVEACTAQTFPEEQRPASNAEINRELALLKRMFSRALQAGKLLYRPHIPLLKENNVRTGFFEREQFDSVLAHLPVDVRPVIPFAYITGWRIASEVLPLQWRQVDFDAGEVRLDAGTTKDGDGCVFPMTADLRSVLSVQRAEHERLKKAGYIIPHVFFREVAEGRGGEKKPQRIVSFDKAWKSSNQPLRGLAARFYSRRTLSPLCQFRQSRDTKGGGDGLHRRPPIRIPGRGSHGRVRHHIGVDGAASLARASAGGCGHRGRRVPQLRYHG